MKTSTTRIVCLLLAVCVTAVALVAADTPPATTQAGGSPKDAELFAKFAQSPLLLTGKIKSAKLGPVGMSEPPVYSVTLVLESVAMLRGIDPKATQFSFNVRQANAPTFDEGGTAVVAAMVLDGRVIASTIVPATDANLADARLAASLPIGWTIENGKPLSPWAQAGGKAWTGDAKPAGQVCSKTQRPALMAGPGVTLSVEKVIPEKVHEFKNPFGDGEFTVTVANTTDKDIEVPALLTDGKEILWADSLVIVDGRGRSHVLPGAGKAEIYRPAKLKAGEKVSGKINTLQLKDVNWPNGGSRVNFTFGLGEMGATDFFYYLTNYHGPLRAKLQ